MISLKWIKPLKKFYWLEKNIMPELHLEQPGFTYSVCVTFTKHRQRIQKFRGTANLKHLYRNESGKA